MTFSSILSQSEVDYAAWAIELRREYSARRKSARRISGKDSSCWPSPTVQEATGASVRGDGGLNLRTEVAHWPTAQTHDSIQRGNTAADNHYYEHDLSNAGEKGGPNQRGSKGDAMLEPAALKWATPQALSFDQSHQPGQNAHAIEAKNWPTASTMNGEGTLGENLRKESKFETNHAINLGQSAARWGAPSARDCKDSGDQSELVSINGLLSRQAERTFPAGAPFSDMPLICCLLSLPKRKLNPRFDECLMGWPLNWTLQCATESTGLGPAAMALYLSRQRWLLSRLLAGSE